MDNLDFANLFSSSVYDLNTKFNDRCYMDWSKTNLISIVTLDGIYILKPQLDVHHGPFQIELIRNPKCKFKHQSLCSIGPTFDNMWQTLDPRQYVEVFLDPALMSNVDKLSLDLYPRHFRLAKWSPLIENFPRHCLLAAITIDYQLLIYTRKNSTWVTHSDLSAHYDTLWAQLNSNQDSSMRGNFDVIKNNLHSLSFYNVCWKETIKGHPILLATTIPGDIIVWQIVTQTSSDDLQTSTQQFEVKTILRTNMEFISSMQLFESLLIIASRDGQVVLYDLTTNFNEIEDSTNQQVSNGSVIMKTLSVITLPPTAILWHRDNIEVTDFYVQSIFQGTFRIVLSKSTNICWCIINYTKKTDKTSATLAISDSFSAIDGLDPDVSLNQTPATWLKPAGDRRAVLIADDGSFFQLEFIGDCQDTSPEFNAINTGCVDLTRMIPRGLCTSPNGHMMAMISSISLMYEPSKISAPTKVLLQPIINDKIFFVDCIQELFDEVHLKSKCISSPMDVCDQIDYLRSIFPLLTYEHFCDLFKTLREIVSKIGLPQNETQLVKLKIASFLLTKLSESRDLKMTGGDQRADIDLKVCDMILLYHIRNILSTVFSKTDKNVKFNDKQITSMRNFFSWLDKCPEGEGIKKQYLDSYNDFESQYSSECSEKEFCSICQTGIPFVSLAHGTCRNGHRFDRCARSLIIMNLKTDHELICEYCKRHYMTRLIWQTNDLWLCSYCQ